MSCQLRAKSFRQTKSKRKWQIDKSEGVVVPCANEAQIWRLLTVCLLVGSMEFRLSGFDKWRSYLVDCSTVIPLFLNIRRFAVQVARYVIVERK